MFRRSLLFNFLLIIGICFVLYFLFFKSLGCITHHGSEVTVPNLIHRDMRVAIEELGKQGYEVVIDSTYDESLKPFTVVSQLPEVGELVKRGRTIFITVNKSTPPMIPMPNLNGLSFRSAEMVIKSNRLILGDTSYKPDIAEGAILQQSIRGTVINPGTMVPQGSPVDLVIGNGLGGTEFNVPDLLGMTVVEALAVINANNLQYTAIPEGHVTDSATGIVFMQTPNGYNELNQPNRIREGDFIDFRYKQTVSEGELDSNRMPGKYLIQQVLDENDKPVYKKPKSNNSDSVKAKPPVLVPRVKKVQTSTK